MLNFVYWPISFILWFWHKAFSFVFNPDSGVSWVLAIMFLTFTIRAILVKPMLNSTRSMSKMQELQPHMAAIKERYKGDQQKIMEETRKLQKELGINPVAGCLPALVQMPVFLGLFHVLRSFNRTGTGPGQLGLSVEANRTIPNYFFSAHDVQSFLDARLFGVPLSAYITMKPEMYQAFQPVNFNRINIMMVAIPLILIIAAATHFNGKASVARTRRRQEQGLSKAPQSGQMQMQAEMMNKMAVWVFPCMILFTGALWHIGLLFYMMANNVWTYFQQHWLFKKIDKEEAEALEAKRLAKRATAPKPGVKPVNPKKGGKAPTSPSSDSDDDRDAHTPGAGISDNTESAAPSGGLGSLKGAWRQMKADAERQYREKQQAEQQKTAGTSADKTPHTTAPKPGQKPAGGKNKRGKNNKRR